jgi:deoxycytidylate deaminase
MNLHEECFSTSPHRKIKTALRILSKYVDEYCMVAICFNGSRVVSWGLNKMKTDPFSSTRNDLDYRYEKGDGRPNACNRHAEIDAIKKSRSKNIDLIIVMRMKKNGDVSKSMPCNMCRKYIEHHNISRIIYADWDGDIIMEKC